jgi:hypothetical protein
MQATQYICLPSIERLQESCEQQAPSSETYMHQFLGYLPLPAARQLSTHNEFIGNKAPEKQFVLVFDDLYSDGVSHQFQKMAIQQPTQINMKFLTQDMCPFSYTHATRLISWF